MKPFLLPVLFTLFLSGCGGMYFDPTLSESRSVTAASNASQTVTLNEPMVWYDNPVPQKGLLLPAGTYTLHYEDSEFLYFKAPSEIEYRILKPTPKNWFNKGGIALPKSGNVVQVYSETGPGSILFTWRLDRVFNQMENRKWSKSF